MDFQVRLLMSTVILLFDNQEKPGLLGPLSLFGDTMLLTKIIQTFLIKVTLYQVPPVKMVKTINYLIRAIRVAAIK